MNDHLSLEDLAELVEGHLAHDVSETRRRHLARCEDCASAFADTVRHRTHWLTRRDRFELPTMVARDLERRTGERISRPRRPWVPRERWIPLLAVVPLVLAVTWLAAGGLRRGSMRELHLPPAVRSAVESSSARGLVLPGGERRAMDPPSTMRSGVTQSSPDLKRELDALVEGYETGPPSAESTARLLAALLAADDLETANAYAREAMRRFPEDPRVLVLVASLHFRRDDLARAESLLRDAERLAPRDPLIRFDLGLVLRERGDHAEARKRLRGVAAGGGPLAERARRELAR